MIGTRNPGCRQIIDDAFRQAPVSPTYVFRSDDNPTIQGLIGSGLAYAVLPLLTVDEHDPHVAVIPIRPAPPPRRLGIAWHPERRPPLALSPLSRWRPRSAATSASSGQRRGPREPAGHATPFAAETAARTPTQRSDGSDRRARYASAQTPSSFPLGSVKWNRRPPGNSYGPFTTWPPAFFTASTDRFRSVE